MMEVFSDGSLVIDNFGCTEGSTPPQGGDLPSCTIKFFKISSSVSSARCKSNLSLPSKGLRSLMNLNFMWRIKLSKLLKFKSLQ